MVQVPELIQPTYICGSMKLQYKEIRKTIPNKNSDNYITKRYPLETACPGILPFIYLLEVETRLH